MIPRVHCPPEPILPAVVGGINFNVAITLNHTEWKTADCQSHRFLNDIRSEVLRYRRESPTRFNIPIEVGQVLSQTVEPSIHPHLRLWVGFYNFGKNPVFAACRPTTRMRHDGSGMSTGGIQAYWQKQGKWVPLEQFLKKEFPTYSHIPVGDLTMFEWWQVNGKVFNWSALPNELKEHILGFCFTPLPRVMIRRRIGTVLAKEVTEKFGGWVTLLRVSRQMRTLCLRMCFVGSQDGKYGHGLCIEANEPSKLRKIIRRLSRCPQMLMPGGIPVDEASCRAKELYDRFPRIYPELHQYATMCHAIRKISLSMSFINSMHFFLVTAHSFAEYSRYSWLDYEVFERMPQLKEIQIILPDATEHLEGSSWQRGPRLFYGKPFNCPRVLHRLIYERVAEALAIYDNVKVQEFMEEAEETRYNAMRQDAQARLNLTTQDLEELYREEGGGIQLEKSVRPGGKDVDDWWIRQPPQDPFWPPKCRCEIRCHDFLSLRNN